MIIDINDLRKYDFQISKINIIRQKPVYRELECKSRMINGFLFILQGKCKYTFGSDEFELNAGSVVYLPKGSKHVFSINSDDTEFYRIDFNLTINGEFVYFSEGPLKVCHEATAECVEAFKAMADECEYHQDYIRKAELMCTALRSLTAKPANARRERLAPAVHHILKNLTGKVNCSDLAKMCNLASSQFYSLFKAEYGISPLEYRDDVVVKRAVMFLRDGTFSVTEVSEMLGFDSVSYFSRFFKKHRGVSPKTYTKNT